MDSQELPPSFLEREQIAQQLTELISSKGIVKKVAVGGGFFNHAKPKDLDLIILIDNKHYPDLLKTISNIKNSSSVSNGYLHSVWVDLLHLDQETNRKFTLALSSLYLMRRLNVDFWVLPESLNNEMLTGELGKFYPPSFLANVNRDALVYDPQNESFIKRTVFGPESSEAINSRIREEIVKFNNMSEEEKELYTEEIWKRQEERLLNRQRIIDDPNLRPKV